MTTTLVPELDPFQLDTLSFLDHARGRAVIADPMGARKTATALCWLARTGVQRTLVVAPSSVHGHWARETARFYPGAITLHGNDKDRRHEAIASALANADEGGSWPVVYVTTYESMKADQRLLNAAKFDCVIFDEGHRLKGRTNQVGLCSNSITKTPKHCIIVTGTPVLNHASELWQYLHILAPKVYTAFWRWAEEHYMVEVRNFRGNRFPTKIIHGFREGHEEIVRNQIAPFVIQRDIADLFPGAAWVEEPDHVEIAVELSPGERKAYDSLVKHKWAIVGAEEITTRNSLDLSTRLSQLTSEWDQLGSGESGTKTKTAVELVLDLLERDEPVLVLAKYQATVQRIVDGINKHGHNAMPYHGGVPAAIRDDIVAAFAAGRIDVIVGTLDSLSEGVDGLQHRCANVVLVDRHWTPAKNDQAIGRVRRSGQLRKVTVYHVFAVDTIDATVTAACLRKTNVIQMLKGRPLLDAIYGRV